MGKPAWRILTLSLGDDIVSRKRAIGLSIEKGSVCIADGQRSLSRIRIKALRRSASEEGKYPSPENVASAAFLAVRELKARNAEICLGIPKAWSVIRSIELPASVKDTLPDVISYELDRLTPFSPDDAFYDFRILEEQPEKIRIVIAAVRADLIDPYLSALREKKIRVDRVSLNLTGMAALLGFAGHGGDAVFLDVDDSGYECALIRQGSVSSVLVGHLEDSDEESILNSALQEVMPFVDQMRDEGKPPQLIFHLRGRLADRGYSILERLATLPCKVLNDMDLKLEIPGRGSGIPYTALGVVLESLRPNAAGMNLLTKGRHRESGKPWAVTAALCLAALAAGIFYLISPIAIEGKSLEEIDRQIALRKDEVSKIETIRKEIDGVNKEIATINHIKADRPLAMDILKELTVILPKNVWLTRLRLTDAGVDIEGQASGSAAELLPVLESSKYFKTVEFSSPTFRDARMNAERFIIKMEIEAPNDERRISETKN